MTDKQSTKIQTHIELMNLFYNLKEDSVKYLKEIRDKNEELYFECIDELWFEDGYYAMWNIENIAKFIPMLNDHNLLTDKVVLETTGAYLSKDYLTVVYDKVKSQIGNYTWNQEEYDKALAIVENRRNNKIEIDNILDLFGSDGELK